jgi:hypothetical protein
VDIPDDEDGRSLLSDGRDPYVSSFRGLPDGVDLAELLHLLGEAVRGQAEGENQRQLPEHAVSSSDEGRILAGLQVGMN